MIKGKGKKRYRIDRQRPDLRLGLILFLLVLAVQPVAGAGPPPRAKLILVNLTRVAFADFDTGITPSATVTNRRPAWTGLRPGNGQADPGKDLSSGQ